MAFFSRFLPKSRRYMYNFIRDRDCFFPFLRTRIGKQSSLFPLFFCLFFEITPVYLQNKIEKNVHLRDQNVENLKKNGHTAVILILDVFSTYRGDLEKKPKNKKKYEIFCFIFVFCRHTGVKSQCTFFSIFFEDIPG